MNKVRTDLGFDDLDSEPVATAPGLAGFDPSEWAPAPGARPRPAPQAVREGAERLGFRSREAAEGRQAPAADAAVPPVRRRRTGRNAQLNLKLRPDTIAAFTAIADGNDWGLGETFERAVALLEAEQAARGRGGAG
ncbi:hypothetical protein [Jannaschia sp. LMIT008]|uniref:hypothetical protein n=1 Tax=Jannaschia maritima TaxID=3032585 RepID=UPI002810B2A2|nr:hypothetical protein [Jannaschia sp. LMIT008]